MEIYLTGYLFHWSHEFLLVVRGSKRYYDKKRKFRKIIDFCVQIKTVRLDVWYGMWKSTTNKKLKG